MVAPKTKMMYSTAGPIIGVPTPEGIETLVEALRQTGQEFVCVYFVGTAMAQPPVGEIITDSKKYEHPQLIYSALVRKEVPEHYTREDFCRDIMKNAIPNLPPQTAQEDYP